MVEGDLSQSPAKSNKFLRNRNTGVKVKVKGCKAGFIEYCSSLKPIVLSPLM
jgi:hypothetical protein